MRYNPKLDGLRAIAAIIVVAFHAKVPAFGGGFLGVDVFFVLSGYLITRLLVDENESLGQIDFGRFFIRRLWRLYPALLFLIIVYVFFAPALFPQYDIKKHYQDTVLSGLYLADYARTFGVPLSVLNHTWSLSAEMHFYLVWPIIFTLVLKLPKERIQSVLLAIWLVSTAWRWHGFAWFEDGWDIYNRVDTHSSGLILGALLATMKPIPSRVLGYLGLALVIFSISYFDWRKQSTALFGFSLAEIGAAMIILAPPRWMGGTVLVWIGKMSYGLYLWQYPVVRFMRDSDASWQVSLLIGMMVGISIAAVSYYFIEEPLLKRFRARYRPTENSSL